MSNAPARRDPAGARAAEFRVSRPTVATWVARYRAQGEAGLQDLPSRPHRSPAQLDPVLVAQIHALRRERKWSARRIHHHLVAEGTGCVFVPWDGGCTDSGSPAYGT